VRTGYRDNISEAKAQELRFISCSVHGLNENQSATDDETRVHHFVPGKN